jgi:PAS domain S-box-containing protein
MAESMGKQLRILILEDVPADAELMERELRKGGITFSSKRVDTKEGFLRELKGFEPDLILGDYKLPSFDGLTALAIAQEKFPDIPFIFVSGSIGEELAIETLKKGATDYVLKDRLSRLVPGVNRALRELKERTDRRQAEVEAKKERDRAQTYLNIAGVIFVAINTDHKVILVNRKGCEILGYKEEEILGRNWFDHFVPERDRKSVKTVFAKLMAAEIEPVEYFENSVLTKSGTEKIIAWYNTIITDENGHIAGTLSSGEDITDRKRVEKALRESERRYREVVENATEIIYTVDEKGNFTYSNPAGLNMTGYSLQELRKLNYADLVVPEHRERVSEIYINQFRDRIPSTYVEFPFFGKSGEVIWFGQNSTIVMEGDKFVGFHIIGRNITERKKTEEALRESEEKYRTLVETSPDAITLMDLNLNIIMANQPALKLYGHERIEEVKGRSALDYLVLEERGRAIEDMKKMLGAGTIGPIEYRLVKKDGTPFPAELKASSVLDSQKKPAGVILVSRDISERKRAEDALNESEKRYRTLAEAAPDMIFIVDRRAHIKYVNNFAAKQFSKTPEEIIGKSMSDLFPSDISDRQRHHLQEVFEYGKPIYLENKTTFLDRDVWLSTWLTPLSNEAGEVYSVLGISRDITERKQAEEAIRENEKRFRQLFDEAPVGYFEYDTRGRIVSVNRTELEMLGYTLEEMIGQPVWKFIVEEDIARNLILAKLAGTMPPSRNLERTYRRKDGTIFPALVQDRLLQDAEGKILGIRSTIEDVTDRKRAEDSLKQSEENAMQLAQENAIMAEIGRVISSTLEIDKVYEGFSVEVQKIIPFDRIVINMIDTEKGTVKNVHIAGKELHDRNVKDIYPLEGSGNAEMVRSKSTFLIQTEDFDQYQDRFPMLLSTFQAGFRSIMNVPLFSKGRIIGGLLLRSRAPYTYTDKDVKLAERIASQIAGAVENAQLYAERIQAEQEKAALQEQLRQSQKMEAIGRLAGGVAHDFNNLLTVIKGYSELSLAEMKEEDPFRESVEEIKKSADRASDLTRQLLAFSRRQIMEMKVLNLNTILQNLEKMLRRLIGEDIELTFLSGGDLRSVKVDPGQIEQVIINLSVNARDAMPKGGKLTIETVNAVLDEEYASKHIAVKPGQYVMLSVSDTGIGMTSEVRERVFEPFFTTKERGRGTGLGLSTVYGIVKQSGGNIWVYSEPDRGTTFKIYLPQVNEALEELCEKVETRELPRGTETVLIVEDDKEVRKLAVRILENQGYKVLKASQGSEALPLSKEYQEPIHLMLADVVMPGLDGRELAERVKFFHPQMKVLYMSGYTENAITHHGVLEKGMNYIQKPFAVDALARKVREVLDE